jgi:AcrR family transcriptional regulator
MVSSAIYRYFPSRDELLTALLIDAYDEVGAAVERADAEVSARTDLALRWRRVCDALRGWARANQHEYALLYGSPVPGYAAPETTIAPASRVPQVMLAIAVDAEAAGLPLGVAPAPVPPAEHAALAGVRGLLSAPVADERLVRLMMAWKTVFGHISLELFGHMHRGVLDYDAHYAHVVERLAHDLGLDGR